MLKHLNIKNFALIEEIEIEFGPGLNIIIGETGAGKSIIVDALMLALGERASLSMIRTDQQKAIVEATFSINDNNELEQFLISQEVDLFEDELLVRRELNAKGNSRCFVNDSPVQLSVLKQIGDMLVDFHGQHEHQALLKKEFHLGILDKVTDFGNLKNSYTKDYSELKKKINELKILLSQEKSTKEKSEADIFEFQQIKKIAPQKDEYELLESELIILQNSEQLFNLTNELHQLLSESDESALNYVSAARKILAQLQKIDNKFSEYSNEANSAYISLNEISSFAKNYNLNIDFDSEKIEQIRDRLVQLNGLKKKYGTVDQAISRLNDLEIQIGGLTDFETSKSSLNDEIVSLKARLTKTAASISELRKNSAKDLESGIVENLKTLGIQNGSFIVKFETDNIIDPAITDFAVKVDNKFVKLNNSGIDNVEFLISANAGEQPKSLVEVASGGEVSRIMLSIKGILAGKDEVPVMIFDEIDTGISGRIAQKVGFSMKKLSAFHQIIAITHLAQIAALADKNIAVRKNDTNSKTFITVHQLAGEERLLEIAKLISGEQVTDAAIQSVIELSDIMEQSI